MSDANINIEQKAQDIANSSMSPFCPGRTLSACPSSEAGKLREEIKTWLQRGDTTEAIMKQLESAYGQGVSGTPSYSAVGQFGWIAPGLFLAIGFIAICFFLRSQKRGGDPFVDTAKEDVATECELKKRMC